MNFLSIRESQKIQMTVNPDQNLKTENQQEPPQDKEEEKDEEEEEMLIEVEVKEEKHSVSEPPPPIKSCYSPPLLFNQDPKSPSPPPDSPADPTHETYHTHEFRVTPPDTTQAKPPSPPVLKAQDGFVAGLREVQEESGGPGGGVNRPTLRPKLSILKRPRKESMVRRALFGFRICGFVFCLISFSVMAADKNQGWALDSFDRYKEFRYCLAVNVIGFVYSGLQTYDLAYYFTSGKHVIQHHLRHYIDFVMDQILTYLLISTSSSAAIRVDDWESNWGKDKFPDMARASVALSFLAFVAFASCSLISGYTLGTLKSL